MKVNFRKISRWIAGGSVIVVLLIASQPAKAQTSLSAIMPQNSGLCVDVPGGSNQPGTTIEQWSCLPQTNQRFSFIQQTDGSYALQTGNSGLCLDIGANGWQVIQNTCSSATTQKWKLVLLGVSTYQVVNATGGCLNVSGASTQNGGNLIIYGCNTDANEQFKIPNFSGSAPPAVAPVVLPFGQTCPAGSICYYGAGQEGSTYTMSCSSGPLTITDAAYQAPGTGTSCQNYVNSACAGKTNCSVTFSNTNCGLDPVPGVVKTATAIVNCGVKPPAHMPTGMSGHFTTLIDATFGTAIADATVKSRSDLDGLAYYWFEYGPADTDPAYPYQSGTPNYCEGPVGNGADGLYGNFRSRFLHCAPGSPWDRHVLGTDHITLKANCGLEDSNASNCADANIGGGMLRFITSFRPTASNPIVVEMKSILPKGMYGWPAFWLNPGQQAPRNAGGSPGKILSATWPPEIDIFDEFGFNNTKPGHYLIMGDPTNNDDAAYASPLCASQNQSVCDLPITPGGALLPTTTVATFSGSGWYATTYADLTADWHLYSVRLYPDHTEVYLDGILYRERGYTWPTSAPPMQLLISNQTGAKFNDLSAITDQGGIPHGWDWQIAYVRVWQQQ